MTFSVGPVEIYQQNKNLVTDVCSGPGGLVIACLSILKNAFTNKIEDNLSIWTIDNGIHKVGAIKLSNNGLNDNNDKNILELHQNLDNQSRILWHPSGEQIVVIIGGTLHFINMQWSLRNSSQRVHFNNVILKNNEIDGNGGITTNDDSLRQIVVKLECFKTLHIMASTACAINNSREIVVGTANAQIRRFGWKGLGVSERYQLSNEHFLYRTTKIVDISMNNINTNINGHCNRIGSHDSLNNIDRSHSNESESSANYTLYNNNMVEQADDDDDDDDVVIREPGNVPQLAVWGEKLKLGCMVMVDGSICLWHANRGQLRASSRVIPVLQTQQYVQNNHDNLGPEQKEEEEAIGKIRALRIIDSSYINCRDETTIACIVHARLHLGDDSGNSDDIKHHDAYGQTPSASPRMASFNSNSSMNGSLPSEFIMSSTLLLVKVRAVESKLQLQCIFCKMLGDVGPRISLGANLNSSNTNDNEDNDNVDLEYFTGLRKVDRQSLEVIMCNDEPVLALVDSYGQNIGMRSLQEPGVVQSTISINRGDNSSSSSSSNSYNNNSSHNADTSENSWVALCPAFGRLLVLTHGSVENKRKTKKELMQIKLNRTDTAHNTNYEQSSNKMVCTRFFSLPLLVPVHSPRQPQGSKVLLDLVRSSLHIFQPHGLLMGGGPESVGVHASSSWDSALGRIPEKGSGVNGDSDGDVTRSSHARFGLLTLPDKLVRQVVSSELISNNSSSTTSNTYASSWIRDSSRRNNGNNRNNRQRPTVRSGRGCLLVALSMSSNAGAFSHMPSSAPISTTTTSATHDGEVEIAPSKSEDFTTTTSTTTTTNNNNNHNNNNHNHTRTKNSNGSSNSDSSNRNSPTLQEKYLCCCVPSEGSVWIYNRYTKRWRYTALQESPKIILLDDVHHNGSSGSGSGSIRRDGNGSEESMTSSLIHEQTQSPSSTTTTHSFDSKQNIVGDDDDDESNRFASHQQFEALEAGKLDTILSVSWYGDHSLVIVDVRRSVCCLEILTRECTRRSAAKGEPEPQLQKCVRLPPGFVPTYVDLLETSTTNLPAFMRDVLSQTEHRSGNSGDTRLRALDSCSTVLLSDGITVMVFAIAALVHSNSDMDSKSGQTMNDASSSSSMNTNSLSDKISQSLVSRYRTSDHPCDYLIGLLWQGSLMQSLSVTRTTTASSNSGNISSGNIPPSPSTSPSTSTSTSRELSVRQMCLALKRVRECDEEDDEYTPAAVVLDTRGTAFCFYPTAPSQGTLSSISAELLFNGCSSISRIENLPTSSETAIGKSSRDLLGTVLLLSSNGRMGSRFWLPQVTMSPQLRAPPLGRGERVLYCSTGLQAAVMQREVHLSTSSPPSSSSLLSTAARLLMPGGTSSVRMDSVTLWLVDGLLHLCLETNKSNSKIKTGQHHSVQGNIAIILKALLADARQLPSVCSLLANGLELRLKSLTERVQDFEHTPDFALTTAAFFASDELLTLEVLCRLGRKLEPAVSRRMFPLANIGHVQSTVTMTGIHLHGTTISPSPWSQLTLFELCLDMGLYEHAALMLTLACEQVGGADSKESTTQSLVMSIELLYQCIRRCSLVVATDVLQFISRLEALLSCQYDSNMIAWEGNQSLPLNEFILRSKPIEEVENNSVDGCAMVPPTALLTVPLSSTTASTTSSSPISNSSTAMTATTTGFGIYPQALASLGGMIAASPSMSYYVASSLLWSVARTVGALGAVNIGNDDETSEDINFHTDRDITTNTNAGNITRGRYTVNSNVSPPSPDSTVFEVLQWRLGNATVEKLLIQRSLTLQMLVLIQKELLLQEKYFTSAVAGVSMLSNQAGKEMLHRAFYSKMDAAGRIPINHDRITGNSNNVPCNTGSAVELINSTLAHLGIERAPVREALNILNACQQGTFFLSRCAREQIVEKYPGNAGQDVHVALNLGTSKIIDSSSRSKYNALRFTTLPPHFSQGNVSYASLLAGVAFSFLLIGRGDATAILLSLLGSNDIASLLVRGHDNQDSDDSNDNNDNSILLSKEDIDAIVVCMHRMCDCSEEAYIITNTRSVIHPNDNDNDNDDDEFNNSSSSSVLNLMLKDLVQRHANSLGL